MQNSDKQPDTHIQIFLSNKWQAVRYGIEGVFIDPITLKQQSIKQAIEDLCLLVEPIMVSLGTVNYIDIIHEILIEGTGTSYQRNVFNKSGSFEYMIQSMLEQFYK